MSAWVKDVQGWLISSVGWGYRGVGRKKRMGRSKRRPQWPGLQKSRAEGLEFAADEGFEESGAIASTKLWTSVSCPWNHFGWMSRQYAVTALVSWLAVGPCHSPQNAFVWTHLPCLHRVFSPADIIIIAITPIFSASSTIILYHLPVRQLLWFPLYQWGTGVHRGQEPRSLCPCRPSSIHVSRLCCGDRVWVLPSLHNPSSC